MQYPEYSKDTVRYEIGEGYALEKADGAEFATHYVAYRDADVDFLLSWEAQFDEVAGLRNLFWILRGNSRNGGVIMGPNYIEGLFLQPPEIDTYGVLCRLIPVLLAWSDPGRDIITSEILDRELDAYIRLGFRVMHSNRYTIRPTEVFNAAVYDSVRIARPERRYIPEIVDLFTQAFAGSVAPLGSYSPEKHQKNVSGYFDRHGDVDILNRASSLLYDKSTDELVGACLVQAGAVLPSINWLAVAEKYRRRGLASAMIRRALTVLHEKYRWLKINVHAGNPSAALYHSLGFRPGLAQTSVYMPARSGGAE